MKTKVIVILLAIVATVFSASAQTSSTKIGYADVDYIFSLMPEAKQIEAELQSLNTQLQNQLNTRVQAFQTKVAEYQKNAANMIEAVRENEERELTQMQQNIQKLEQDAQNTLQKKQAALMDPVYDKVGKNIEAVAKENGFDIIINQQLGGLDVVLYADVKLDISDLVLKKMGITPPPSK
jgi:outer membrane protein